VFAINCYDDEVIEHWNEQNVATMEQMEAKHEAWMKAAQTRRMTTRKETTP
jgi:hypothetical protein